MKYTDVRTLVTDVEHLVVHLGWWAQKQVEEQLPVPLVEACLLALNATFSWMGELKTKFITT